MSFYHSANPSEYPDTWAFWAYDYEPFCGECGTSNPDLISSHYGGCTVADRMREAWDTDNPGFWHDTIAEQTGDDR